MLDRMQLSYRDTATDLCYNSVDQLTADTYCRLEGKLGGGVRRSVNGSKVGMSIIQELKCPPKMKNFDDCAFKKVDTNCSGKYLKIDCLETTGDDWSYSIDDLNHGHTSKLTNSLKDDEEL